MAEKMEAEFAEEETESGGNTNGITRSKRPWLAPAWKPGQSGNPSGRPKKKPITQELEKLLSEIDPKDKKKRTYARRLVVAIAEEVIKKGNVSAFAEIADRVEGKVAQRQEHSGPDGGPMQFETAASRQEVEVRIALLLQQAQERRADAPKEAPVIEASSSHTAEPAASQAQPLAIVDIPLLPIERSSNVAAAGYDPVGRALVVEYKSGDRYVWRKIPTGELEALRTAESAGRYMRQIEARYGVGEKIESPARSVESAPVADIDLDW